LSGRVVPPFLPAEPKERGHPARQRLPCGQDVRGPFIPYRFDFLGLAEEAQEREIENALVKHVTEFLLELGAGFAFVSAIRCAVPCQDGEERTEWMAFSTKLS